MEGVLSSFPYLNKNKCCFHMMRFQSSAQLYIQFSRTKFRQQIPDFKSIDSTDETVESVFTNLSFYSFYRYSSVESSAYEDNSNTLSSRYLSECLTLYICYMISLFSNFSIQTLSDMARCIAGNMERKMGNKVLIMLLTPVWS